jgi:hypothetical protein
MDDIGFFHENGMERGDQGMSNRIQVLGVKRRHENAAGAGGNGTVATVPAAAIDHDIHANIRKARREFLNVAFDAAKDGGRAFLSDHADFHNNRLHYQKTTILSMVVSQ